MKKAASVVLLCAAALTIFLAGCASQPAEARTPVLKAATAQEKKSVSGVATPFVVAPVAPKQTVSSAAAKQSATEKELEFLFQETSKTLDTVLVLAKEGKDTRPYLMTFSDFAVDASPDVTKNKLSQNDELYIERLKKLLLKREKAKLLEINLVGTGLFDIKACDKDGVCENFSFVIVQENGIWGIYEVSKTDALTARSNITNYSWTTTEEPFNLIKRFFDLMGRNQTAETAKLFTQKQGTSTIGVAGVVKAIKGLQIDKLEKTTEKVKELLRATVRIWDPDRESETIEIYFIKGKDNRWRIATDPFRAY